MESRRTQRTHEAEPKKIQIQTMEIPSRLHQNDHGNSSPSAQPQKKATGNAAMMMSPATTSVSVQNAVELAEEEMRMLLERVERMKREMDRQKEENAQLKRTLKESEAKNLALLAAANSANEILRRVAPLPHHHGLPLDVNNNNNDDDSATMLETTLLRSLSTMTVRKFNEMKESLASAEAELREIQESESRRRRKDAEVIHDLREELEDVRLSRRERRREISTNQHHPEDAGSLENTLQRLLATASGVGTTASLERKLDEMIAEMRKISVVPSSSSSSSIAREAVGGGRRLATQREHFDDDYDDDDVSRLLAQGEELYWKWKEARCVQDDIIRASHSSRRPAARRRRLVGGRAGGEA